MGSAGVTAAQNSAVGEQAPGASPSEVPPSPQGKGSTKKQASGRPAKQTAGAAAKQTPGPTAKQTPGATAKQTSGRPAKQPKPESRLAMIRRARRINRELAEVYPYAHPELDFRNPFELLVATVLSAQTTDLRVNQTTPALFSAYPTPEAMAAAAPEDLEELIRPTGFFRAKSRSLLGLSQALCEKFGGEVPGRLEDLVTLPGVGRKTANVVLGNAFGFAT